MGTGKVIWSICVILTPMLFMLGCGSDEDSSSKGSDSTTVKAVKAGPNELLDGKWESVQFVDQAHAVKVFIHGLEIRNGAVTRYFGYDRIFRDPSRPLYGVQGKSVGPTIMQYEKYNLSAKFDDGLGGGDVNLIGHFSPESNLWEYYPEPMFKKVFHSGWENYMIAEMDHRNELHPNNMKAQTLKAVNSFSFDPEHKSLDARQLLRDYMNSSEGKKKASELGATTQPAATQPN